MKKKTLIYLVTTLLLVTILISHHAFARSNSSSIDPNVVALNNARIGNCWLHHGVKYDHCLHLQSNLGCSPCDDLVPEVPPLPEPPEPPGPLTPPSN